MPGIVPITQAFLNPGDLLALGFKEGFVFFRILSAVQTRYAPYRVGAIDANSTLVNHRIRDPDSKEILEIPQTYPNIIYHGAVGIKPSTIRMWIRTPDTRPLSGEILNTASISPQDLSPKGYIEGYESPYYCPMTATEFFSIYRISSTYNFWNTDVNEMQVPTLNIVFRKYRPETLKIDIHRELIRDIALGRRLAKFYVFGAPEDPAEYPSELSKEHVWGVRPISLEEAARL